jgi:pimeloyl-ACP methyl ester carboxylesterase
MAYLEVRNGALYYTDYGEGEPIITLHGLSESGLYWTLPGITDRLVAAGYRVINLDMRGHGRTRVDSTDPGYDVDTMSGDIGQLADSLGLEQFHLLTHATGGMVGFRYAMNHSERLLGVMATDTGSATLPGIRAVAREHMYFNRMHAAVNPESAFAMYEACAVAGNPDRLADFVESFYNDPDPKIAGLRGIQCPCLMLLGEYDVQFIKPAELVAREIPNCTHRVLEGMGHMLALENPQRFGDELLAFLGSL